jgi:tryptophan synthase alpha chain
MAIKNNRIDALFSTCKQENRAALILYITSGFPTAEVTKKLLPILTKAGCDLIELGIPFSDPIADGPVIQKASTVALNAGITFPKTLGILSEYRKSFDNPVILFGALNPYLARGAENSVTMAKQAGADGFLAADLPIEEADELRLLLENKDLHLITLVAPTTPDSRFDQITENASGFLYCISMKGTTGGSQGLGDFVGEYIKRLKDRTDIPLALGFGISTPQDVRQAVATGVDAVVIGSALIRLIETTINEGGDVETVVFNYVNSLAKALKRAV